MVVSNYILLTLFVKNSTAISVQFAASQAELGRQWNLGQPILVADQLGHPVHYILKRHILTDDGLAVRTMEPILDQMPYPVLAVLQCVACVAM